MMYNGAEWNYGRGEDYQLVELPYQGDAYCADIILPAEGIDIRTWTKSLNAERWQEMIDRIYSTEVTLLLPKFSLNYQRSLAGDLQALGITDAFGGTANFSRLSEMRTFINLFLQYTFMQVDEEGTEAAAVTVATMGLTAASLPKQLTIDRPFLFVIREREYGTILFTALIGHPEWQKQQL